MGALDAMKNLMKEHCKLYFGGGYQMELDLSGWIP